MKEDQDPDFIAKLAYYKTAFSPMYNQFVAIKNHYFDSNGDVIIECELAEERRDALYGSKIIFRSYELMNYVL